MHSSPGCTRVTTVRDACSHYINAKTLARGSSRHSSCVTPELQHQQIEASQQPTTPLIPARTSATHSEFTSTTSNNGCPLHRCTSARWPRLLVQADPHNCSVRRAATWLLSVRLHTIMNIRKTNSTQLYRQRRLNTRHLRRRFRHPRRRHTFNFRLQHQHAIRAQALQDWWRGTREQGRQDSAVSSRLRRRW
jgi:hypothetical protein